MFLFAEPSWYILATTVKAWLYSNHATFQKSTYQFVQFRFTEPLHIAPFHQVTLDGVQFAQFQLESVASQSRWYNTFVTDAPEPRYCQSAIVYERLRMRVGKTIRLAYKSTAAVVCTASTSRVTASPMASEVPLSAVNGVEE